MGSVLPHIRFSRPIYCHQTRGWGCGALVEKPGLCSGAGAVGGALARDRGYIAASLPVRVEAGSPASGGASPRPMDPTGAGRARRSWFGTIAGSRCLVGALDNFCRTVTAGLEAVGGMVP